MTNVTSKADCLANPDNEWVNSMYNYDNIINALFTLFIVATLDGWVDAMYKGIDAVGVDMQPQLNHNEYMAFFFLIYLLVMGFFVVNMFVGVIIDNFHKCCEEQSIIEAAKKEERRRLGLDLSTTSNFLKLFILEVTNNDKSGIIYLEVSLSNFELKETKRFPLKSECF